MAEALRSDLLGDVPHGFMTRRSGVSTGVVAGLQCGFGAGDEEDDVRENRRLAVEAVMPGAALVTPFQVHSADAVIVRQPWAWNDRPQADAVVTDRPGIVVGVVTADCAPVLLADRTAGVVAAAHAGWRGAQAGIVESTLAAMATLGAEPARTAAAIGPCIAQRSYEVDDGFRRAFASDDDAHFFAQGRAGHWQFDLEAYVADRLAKSGVVECARLGRDTYAEERAFYSFRRATHRGEAHYGRQLSMIGLPV